MTILSILLSGVLLGATQGGSPGPHSALLISETLKSGFQRGISIAFAPVVATFPILLITIPFASQIAQHRVGLGILALIGAIYLGFIGVGSFQSANLKTESLPKRPISPFWSGFNSTLLSPHPYLFWSTAGAALLVSAYENSLLTAVMFLFSFLFVFFLVKVALASVAHQMRANINGQAVKVFSRSLSVILILFALWLGIDGLKFLGVVS